HASMPKSKSRMTKSEWASPAPKHFVMRTWTFDLRACHWQSKTGSYAVAATPGLKNRLRWLLRPVFARFRAADYHLAAEEFLVVQFLHRALRFLDRLHLNKGETFRTLIVAVAHDFGVLDVADAVEELEEIALGRVE